MGSQTFSALGLSLGLIVVSIFSTLTIIPVLLVILCYRLLVCIFVKTFRPDLDSFVSGLNVIMTIVKPEKAWSNIMICFVVEGKISSAKLAKMFQERVFGLKDAKQKLIYQRLRQSWTSVLGYAFWKDDKTFQLNNHVRNYDYEGELSLPSSCKEQDLHYVWPKLAEAPWKLDQSPWELLVVPKYLKPGTAHAHTLLIFRVDHIHCDVYSIIGLFRVLFNSPFTTPKASRNKRELSSWQQLQVALTLGYKVNKTLLFMLQGKSIGGRQANGSCHCSITNNIPLDTIKQIKKMHNVDFSTVVHAAVQGAVARAFQNAGKVPPKSNCLFNVLPLANHPGGWNLHATFVAIKLPCASYDSKERLLESQRILNKFDQDLPFTTERVMKLLALAPLSLVRGSLLISNKWGPGFTMSNFPTTLNKEYVDGAEIVDVFTALTTFDYFGITISSWGVNGQQRFNFFVYTSIFGDGISATKLAEFFEEELRSLQVFDKEDTLSEGSKMKPLTQFTRTNRQ